MRAAVRRRGAAVAGKGRGCAAAAAAAAEPLPEPAFKAPFKKDRVNMLHNRCRVVEPVERFCKLRQYAPLMLEHGVVGGAAAAANAETKSDVFVSGCRISGVGATQLPPMILHSVHADFRHAASGEWVEPVLTQLARWFFAQWWYAPARFVQMPSVTPRRIMNCDFGVGDGFGSRRVIARTPGELVIESPGFRWQYSDFTVSPVAYPSGKARWLEYFGVAPSCPADDGSILGAKFYMGTCVPRAENADPNDKGTTTSFASSANDSKNGISGTDQEGRPLAINGKEPKVWNGVLPCFPPFYHQYQRKSLSRATYHLMEEMGLGDSMTVEDYDRWNLRNLSARN